MGQEHYTEVFEKQSLLLLQSVETLCQPIYRKKLEMETSIKCI